MPGPQAIFRQIVHGRIEKHFPNGCLPGDALHFIIREFFKQDFREGCGCKALVDEMNAKGCNWAKQPDSLKRIIAKMRGEAKHVAAMAIRFMVDLTTGS